MINAKTNAHCCPKNQSNHQFKYQTYQPFLTTLPQVSNKALKQLRNSFNRSSVSILLEAAYSCHKTYLLTQNLFVTKAILKANLTQQNKSPKQRPAFASSGKQPKFKFLNLSRSKSLKGTLRDDHLREVVVKHQMLSGDIESHPGPRPPSASTPTATSSDTTSATEPRNNSFNLSVTSYNVRGLNDEKKLRHLLNYCYGTLGGKDVDSIYAFQETYISQAGKIPYLWRGNYQLTPGAGGSCGCLTLLSSHVNVAECRDLGNRGHVLACQKSGEPAPFLIFANIYAPNPNVKEKIDFFESVFETINDMMDKHNTKSVLIAGDFNLIFKSSESKNRMFTAQERRISEYVSSCARTYGMSDLWDTRSLYTWHRANSDTFSTIDRVLYTNESVSIVKKKVNWSLSMSDHGAIEAKFSLNATKNLSKSKITRLDPSLLKNSDAHSAINNAFREMLSDLDPTWNPHLKLEFAKMCLRTVVEKVQADIKRKDKSEEDYLNEELNLAVNSLANNQSPAESNRLIDYIEELRAQKAELIEVKGRRLAEKLGTKWYNEGENQISTS